MKDDTPRPRVAPEGLPAEVAADYARTPPARLRGMLRLARGKRGRALARLHALLAEVEEVVREMQDRGPYTTDLIETGEFDDDDHFEETLAALAWFVGVARGSLRSAATPAGVLAMRLAEAEDDKSDERRRR